MQIMLRAGQSANGGQTAHNVPVRTSHFDDRVKITPVTRTDGQMLVYISSKTLARYKEAMTVRR